MNLKKLGILQQKLLSEFSEWKTSMSKTPGDKHTIWNLCQGQASKGLPCLWCDDCRNVGFRTCIACGQAIKTQKTLKDV